MAADDDREPEPAANPAAPKSAEPKPTRKPGKQPGAPGIGRTQVFQANAEQAHYPERCAGCGRPLAPAGRWPTPAFRRWMCTGTLPPGRS